MEVFDFMGAGEGGSGGGRTAAGEGGRQRGQLVDDLAGAGGGSRGGEHRGQWGAELERGGSFNAETVSPLPPPAPCRFKARAKRHGRGERGAHY